MITVDPVGWFPPTRSRVPVNYWLDLDAKPYSKDASDYIAAIGYEWGQSVKGIANTYYPMLGKHHADFSTMVNNSSAYSIIKKYSIDRSQYCGNW